MYDQADLIQHLADRAEEYEGYEGYRAEAFVLEDGFELSFTEEEVVDTRGSSEYDETEDEPSVTCRITVDGRGLTPPALAAVRRMLDYAFRDIHYDYHALTDQEKSLVEPAEFDEIIAWIK